MMFGGVSSSIVRPQRAGSSPFRWRIIQHVVQLLSRLILCDPMGCGMPDFYLNKVGVGNIMLID